MNLESFKVETLNKTYGNPPPVLVPNQGTYQGECVSYTRQYCEAVQGVKTGAWGNAVDWWNNLRVQQFYDQITGLENRRDGDILVWGKGSITSEFGHIGTAYGGKILNQNYGNSRKVTVNDFFSSGYLGALRLKGGNQVVQGENGKFIYRACLHREPENDWVWKQWDGQTFDVALTKVRATDEWLTQNHVLKVAYPEALKTIEAQKKEIEELKKGGTELKPGKYLVK